MSGVLAWLLDTNILLRDADTTSAHHAAARAALLALAGSGARLCITPQVLIEFWAVASRPIADNGLALDAATIERHLSAYLAAFEMVSDTPAIFDEWRRLANGYAPQGKTTHDTRLVAVMKAHNIGGILTFNTRHFRRFAEGENIVVLDPQSVQSTPDE
jgi:predicted nucleic acid-binding protein